MNPHDLAELEIQKSAESHADETLSDPALLLQFICGHEPHLDQLVRAFRNLPFAEQELGKLRTEDTPALGGLLTAISNLESDLWKRARQDYLDSV